MAKRAYEESFMEFFDTNMGEEDSAAKTQVNTIAAIAFNAGAEWAVKAKLRKVR
jgi:hypothetical protein